MGINEITPLVRTLEPADGESPRGYLLRLADANGMYVQTLIDLATRKTEYVHTIGWDYRLLRPLLGDVTLSENFGYRPNRYVRGRLLFEGHLINAVHIHALHAQICPHCVKTLGYLPSAWDLKAYVACPIHGVMMLRRCDVCGTHIRWRRPGLSTCNCGADLSASTPPPAPRELTGLCEILDAKITGCDGGLLAARVSGLPIKELMACDLAIICKLIVNLAKLFLWLESRVRKPRSGTDISDRLPDVARVLSNWPWEFVRLCGRWRADLPKHREYGCFQSNYKWLFVYLYKNLRRKKHQLAFIVRAALVYAAQRWDGAPVKVKDRSLSNALANRRFGSYSDAAQVLGWTTYTTMRWLANGRLPARSVGTKRRPNRAGPGNFDSAIGGISAR